MAQITYRSSTLLNTGSSIFSCGEHGRAAAGDRWRSALELLQVNSAGSLPSESLIRGLVPATASAVVIPTQPTTLTARFFNFCRHRGSMHGFLSTTWRTTRTSTGRQNFTCRALVFYVAKDTCCA